MAKGGSAMARRDPAKVKRLRIAVRYLLEKGQINPINGGSKGVQARLAEHFEGSRQRVHQIVVEERRRMAPTHHRVSQAS